MGNSNFHILLERYLTGDLTASEKVELASMVDIPGNQAVLEQFVEDIMVSGKYADDFSADSNIRERLFASLNNPDFVLKTSSRSAHRVHFLKTSWFRYAAAVVLVAGGAAVWYAQSEKSVPSVASVTQTRDIQPGTNRAILTVGNSRIALASNKTGINVGSTITYNDGERIADAGELLQLMTPRGGQYQAVLPDGSKVWLNAASSIRFPSKFSGDKREVEIAGEVYIEVARNSKQPFYVHTQKTTVQVLGTSFNVNAYSDEESEKMTLIEGSVRVLVNAGSSSEVLRPGQQAQVLNDELSVLNNQAEVAIAWKNGLFSFNDADLHSVMRQLERWYDIKVKYEGNVSDFSLKGEMYRNVNLSDVLEFLQALGVKFRMEGKTLIVL